MKIAYASPALASLPYYAAITQGFFAQQHVNVQLVRLAPNAAVAALIQGEVDASNSPDTTLIAATRGFPAKVVLSLWKQSPWIIMGKAEINGIQELKGKSIGTNQVGSGPYVYLKAGLERAGMSLSDVNVISSPGTQDTFALMANGQLDAAVLSPPFDAQAQLLGYHEVAFIGDAQESPYIGLGTTEAAMIAALTGSEVEPGAAVAAVLLFRLITFWTPVPIGLFAARDLRRAHAGRRRLPARIPFFTAPAPINPAPEA